MSNTTIDDILQAAEVATRNGRMAWEPTAGRGNSYDGWLLDSASPVRYHLEIKAMSESKVLYAFFTVSDGQNAAVSHTVPKKDSLLAEVVQRIVSEQTRERQAELLDRAMLEFMEPAE